VSPPWPQRLLFVTQHYWPELIGSAPYCTDLAEWLAARGTQVLVFTCRPHYPQGVVPPAYRDGQRDRERHGGVTIKRIGSWIPQRRGAFGRIAAELSFLFHGMAALANGRLRRTDVVVSLCPSILSVLLGVLATRRGGRHVAIVHDIQSGLASGLGMVSSAPLIKAMHWLERVVLNRVSKVLVLSDIMCQRLQANGVRSPIKTLPLWVDTRKIQPVYRRSDNSVVTLLYSGNFGRKQALAQVVEMAVLLEQRNAPIITVLRGEGSEMRPLAEQIAARKLNRIRFAPLVPAERLAESLSEGDIHLVPQDTSVADFTVPSKIFAIMAAGRPFVATARPGSLLWRLMDESHAFLCVPAGDTVALADAVERLAKDPDLRRDLARNGRLYTMTHHDKTMVLERFLAILRRNAFEPVAHGELTAASPDPRA
jgi:colanic acid biosynthesis glycosyl transferase WcaI